MGLMDAQLRVLEFHAKHEFPINVKPGDIPKTDHVRTHLIAEELAELSLAIGEQNIVKIADAIGDLLYVVLGTAVTYGLPADLIFEEIANSNDTKAKRDPNDTRLRSKGESYRAPDLVSVLRKAGVIK